MSAINKSATTDLEMIPGKSTPDNEAGAEVFKPVEDLPKEPMHRAHQLDYQVLNTMSWIICMLLNGTAQSFMPTTLNAI
jgi:hypothetical protein